MELIKENNKKITWLFGHEEFFDILKQYLISEPLLTHFSDDKHVYLTIDAFLGACL